MEFEVDKTYIYRKGTPDEEVATIIKSENGKSYYRSDKGVLEWFYNTSSFAEGLHIEEE